MISNSKAVNKLYDIPHKTVEVGKRLYHVIPENEFTAEDIEELREHDAAEVRFYGDHIYANFLPDDVRPSNVKKL